MVGKNMIGSSINETGNNNQFLPVVNECDNFFNLLQTMSLMEQEIIEVRKTNTEVDRRRHYEEQRTFSHERTTESMHQFLNRHRELTNSLYDRHVRQPKN